MSLIKVCARKARLNHGLKNYMTAETEMRKAMFPTGLGYSLRLVGANRKRGFLFSYPHGKRSLPVKTSN